jgi:SAM-dependent methyltransferase
MIRRFLERAAEKRAARALERQLAYQSLKTGAAAVDGEEIEAGLVAYAREVWSKLERFGPLARDVRVLEVGSGAHGLVFFLGIEGAIGIDPLAKEYATLFPRWQGRAKTIAAFGESLPFEDASFDVVLSDNVVDHARSPAAIVREMVRVLAPGGLLYFTVNIHHPVYDGASRLHGLWTAAGMPYEIGAFADHTVHLTRASARGLFAGHPVTVLHEDTGIAAAKADARSVRQRDLRHLMKRLFFKNANLEIVVRKHPK